MNTDILLVTVTDTERKALFETIESLTGHVPAIGKHGRQSTYYDLGSIHGAQLMMLQVEMGSTTPGGSLSSILTAIDELDPGVIIMVGIAFGMDETKQPIGQVLVSKKLSQYEVQRIGRTKDGKPHIIPRGDRTSSTSWVISRFRATSGFIDDFDTKFGIMLSGEKLVDDIDSRDSLRAIEPEAIGGEMEGAGLYTAAYDRGKPWMVVKAVCDWADGNKREGKAQRQKLAARNASRLVVATIQKGGFPNQGEVEQRPRQSPSQAARRAGHTKRRSIPLPQVKQKITDLDRDRFVQSSFDTIRGYIEEACRKFSIEIENAAAGVTPVTSQKFIVQLYVDGDEKNKAKIWIGGFGFGDRSISYVEGRFSMYDDRSMNDWVSIDETTNELRWKAGNVSLSQRKQKPGLLTAEEAGEYFWNCICSYIG